MDRRQRLHSPAGMGRRQMDGLREFLDDLKRQDLAKGRFLGLLNVLIGRRIETATGLVISTGITWRVLAEWLKKVRWDKEAVRQLGLDPRQLPPRDRQRYWYQAIAQARVDSKEAVLQGDELAGVLRALGYMVGPAPSR